MDTVHETVFGYNLTRFYRWYGLQLARQPYTFIVAYLVTATSLSIGLIRKDELLLAQVYDIWTPRSSRAYYEKAVVDSHWPLSELDYLPSRADTPSVMLQAMATAKDGGNLFRSIDLYQPNNTYISLILQLNRDLRTNVSVISDNQSIYRFEDLCMRWNHNCSFYNEHVAVLDFLIRETPQKLTYPRIEPLSSNDPIYIGNVVGGVTLGNASVTTGGASYALLGAKAIYLVYYLRRGTPWLENMSDQWQKLGAAIFEEWNSDPDKPVKFCYSHSTSQIDGMRQANRAVIERFAFSALLLFLFTSLGQLRISRSQQGTKKWRLDPLTSKPLLGALGLMGAGLAVGASTGGLLWCGYTYIGLVNVVPFLVLSIGVDDIFVISSSWARTDRRDSVEGRMSEAMADAAVSITITSVTTSLSFAIGMTSPILAVQVFCAYASAAIMMCYISMVTFFAPLMAVFGVREHQRRSNVLCCGPKIEPEKFELAQEDVWTWAFEKVYGPWLLTGAVKAMVLALYCVYLAGALYGCTKITQGLEAQDTLPSGFHLTKFYDCLRDYMWPRGLQVEIIFNNVPDMASLTERVTIKQIVGKLESTEFTMGPEGTEFWLREYEVFLTSAFVSYYTENPVVWSKTLEKWSNGNSALKKFARDLAWRPATDKEHLTCRCSRLLSAFRFRIGLQNYGTAESKTFAAATLRNLASAYPIYNITTYMYDWPTLDQLIIILPNTLTSIAIALACMILIAIMFFPRAPTVLWIALTIFSIDIGVIGYLALWGVPMNAISMTTILMSIGYSVDYSAHISYGFQIASGTANERALSALGGLGLPILQGAISTLLGISVLADVTARTIQVFVRTMLIVIASGLFHSCVLLPVLLTLTAVRKK